MSKSKHIAGYRLVEHRPHSRIWLFVAEGVPNQFKIVFNGEEYERFGFWGEVIYKLLHTKSGRRAFRKDIAEQRAFKAELAQPW
jgi:hypothetical protein